MQALGVQLPSCGLFGNCMHMVFMLADKHIKMNLFLNRKQRGVILELKDLSTRVET